MAFKAGKNKGKKTTTKPMMSIRSVERSATDNGKPAMAVAYGEARGDTDMESKKTPRKKSED